MQIMTTVHTAMRNAQEIVEPEKKAWKTVSFKMEPALHEHLEAICEQHGVTKSEFFRQCANGLVCDYIKPKLIEG